MNGLSIVVDANGSKVSNKTEDVRDEVRAGSSIGHSGEEGDLGGLGGAILRLS